MDTAQATAQLHRQHRTAEVTAAAEQQEEQDTVHHRQYQEEVATRVEQQRLAMELLEEHQATAATATVTAQLAATERLGTLVAATLTLALATPDLALQRRTSIQPFAAGSRQSTETEAVRSTLRSCKWHS